jgi:hypothetical protein
MIDHLQLKRVIILRKCLKKIWEMLLIQQISKMEAEAGKKLMEVPSDNKKSLGKLPSKVPNK